MQGLIQEDAKKDEHQVALNTTVDTNVRLYQSWEWFDASILLVTSHEQI